MPLVFTLVVSLSSRLSSWFCFLMKAVARPLTSSKKTVKIPIVQEIIGGILVSHFNYIVVVV